MGNQIAAHQWWQFYLRGNEPMDVPTGLDHFKLFEGPDKARYYQFMDTVYKIERRGRYVLFHPLVGGPCGYEITHEMFKTIEILPDTLCFHQKTFPLPPHLKPEDFAELEALLYMEGRVKSVDWSRYYIFEEL